MCSPGKHTATTCGISVAVTWFPSEESATDPGPWMDHLARDCPLESDGSRENAVSREIVEALHTGLWKNPGGPSAESQHQGIMRSHISRWIVETVKEAYTQADREYDRVTAHEVRALSASWAFNCQVALPDILSAAFWRSSGVYHNSYLRDMARIAEGMSTLGPVVVAQQVVDPGHLHPPP